MPAGTKISRAPRLSTGRARPPPLSSSAIDAEQPRLGFVDYFDDAPAVGGIAWASLGVKFDAQQRARAKAGREPAFALGAAAANEDARSFAVLAPFDGPGDQFAVAVALENVGGHKGRQAALPVEGLAAALDGAVGLEVLDEQFQIGLVAALDAKGAGDVALGDARGRLGAIGRRLAADVAKEFVARGQGAGLPLRARRSGANGARGCYSFGQFFFFGNVDVIAGAPMRSPICTVYHGATPPAQARPTI